MGISEAELKVRQGVIGASDGGIILGLNPWKTRVDLWHDKVYGCKFKGNAATRRGNKFEPMVISFCEEFHECTIAPDVRYERSVFHKGCKVTFAANCDGVVQWETTPGSFAPHKDDRFVFGERVPEKIAEAKTASVRAFEAWGMPGTDAIPDTYLVQTIIQMWCSGALHCHVPLMVGFDEYMYEVPRPAEEMIDDIIVKCCDFWVDHVLPKLRPEGPSPSVKLLSSIERETDSVVAISDHTATMVPDWKEAEAERLRWSKIEVGLKEQLIESLGDSEIGMHDTGFLSYIANTRGARTLKWVSDTWASP